MKNNRLLKGLLAITIAIYPLTVALYPLSASAATKKETVFTTLNTKGDVVDTTVTNHICPLNLMKYEDQTRLKDIINLNGTDTFTQEGTKLTWKVEGKELYYQGRPDAETPIDIYITYYLNGVEMSPEDIKGKSGDVKIKINLKNKLKKTVKINGKYETLYTPFVVMAGTIIKTDDNTNINVSNGRVVSTGDKSVVMSIASPGLYESLNMNDLSKLDDIEFSFTTTDFKMDNIYIIATPKLLDEKDTKVFKDLNKVTESMKALQSGIDQIEDGSNQLANGINDLLKGIDTISSKLPSEESNKANEQKLKYLKGQNESTISKLKGANKQLEAQLKEVDSSLNDAKNGLKEAKEQKNSLASAKEAYDNGTYAQLEAGHNAGVLTDEQEAKYQGIKNVLPIINNSVAYGSTIKALNGTIDALTGTVGLLKQTQESLNTSIEANKGLMELIGGNNKVVESSITTIDSMRTLSGAMNQLNSGVKKLNNGAVSLKNGISKYNNEGIKKLTKYSNKINTYSSKAEALVNLSRNYKGYASDNVDETIFVNKVESIK